MTGERIDRIPAHEIVKRGLIHCPERRRPFREMSVMDNLLAGSYLLKDKRQVEDNLKRVYELFPILQGRSNQISGTLSGGEQQMLAIGRAIMSIPKLLCIDEPSTGLAPIMRREVFRKDKRDQRAWNHRAPGGTGGEHGFQDGLAKLRPLIRQNHR